MRIIADNYDININTHDNIDTVPNEEEYRLILQFMPELYADMMRILSDLEEK